MIYDIAIIGGGAAGHRAACLATDAGMTVVLFEKGVAGGGVVSSGYLAMDTLLSSMEGGKSSHAEAAAKCKAAASQLSMVAEHNLKSRGVTVIKDGAVINGREKGSFVLLQDREKVAASRLLLATGSLPAVPRVKNMDEALKTGLVVTNQELTELNRLPEEVVVFGSNIKGLQMASYARLCGSEVTVICGGRGVAPELEEEVGSLLEKALADMGIAFVHHARLVDVEKNGVFLATPDGEKHIETQGVLLGNNRWPATRGLGLKTLDVATRNGAILSDQTGRTNIADVYAAGDCTFRTLTVFGAQWDSGNCVSSMLGRRRTLPLRPAMFFMRRVGKAASIGETVRTAAENKLRPVSSRLPLPYEGHESGLIKLVADKYTHKLIGAHIIGDGVEDIVLHFTAAVEAGLKVEDVSLPVLSLSSEISSEALYRLRSQLNGVK